jgi:DNA polymerase III epsilon subunit-like protein
MLDAKLVTELVFCDIETTSQYPTFKAMPEKLQEIFKRRHKKDFAEMSKITDQEAYDFAVEEFYSQKTPLQPEWARLLCISIGTLALSDPENKSSDYIMKITSFADADERVMLQKFIASTASITKGPNWAWHWVAHNGSSFDYPFIAKRIILNQLPLPKLWDFGEKKPWDLGHLIDTKNVWKYGVYDNSVSLDHLAYLFGLPSSKDDMDGSQVKDEFWIKGNLRGITHYCEKDILVLAQIYLKIKGMYNQITVK